MCAPFISLVALLYTTLVIFVPSLNTIATFWTYTFVPPQLYIFSSSCNLVNINLYPNIVTFSLSALELFYPQHSRFHLFCQNCLILNIPVITHSARIVLSSTFQYSPESPSSCSLTLSSSPLFSHHTCHGLPPGVQFRYLLLLP